MKAEINKDYLEICPETTTDEYTLSKWIEEHQNGDQKFYIRIFPEKGKAGFALYEAVKN